ncbi:unnamed protein product [Periconia digitata]|uniref:Rhodopsin domain-containing protein n=1 Tax=Periconia digitata TaxID=1303443 RepID=A0A9W4XMA2_9PLEO|nr:unnamed protein product [Periconia digitata]
MIFATTLHRNPGAQADIAVETILLFFVFLTLGLRIWSRAIKGIGMHTNDWLIIASTFVLTARYATELCVIFIGGLGLHLVEAITLAGPNLVTDFLKILYALDLMWITTCALTKLSILFFYTQVFYINKKFVYISYVAIGLCAVYGVSSFFHFAFYCTPVRKSWYPMLDGKCGNDSVKYLLWGSIDIILDVFIIALPLPLLSTLKLPTAKKLGLIGVFGLGLGIVAITGVRFKFYEEIDFTDMTYSLVNQAIFTAMVPLLGIISANIPTIPPALQRMFKSQVFATQKGISTDNSSRPWSTKKTGGSRGGSRFDTDFERLSDHDVPLVNIQAANADPNLNEGKSQIQVTTDWHIQSSAERP